MLFPLPLPRKKGFALGGAKREKRVSEKMALALLMALPVGVALVSLMVGRYTIPLPMLLQVLLGKILGGAQSTPEVLNTVLFAVRLPRIGAAMLVGGALAAAGATYQGLFKNPMVSPDILGASAGAGFGAALAILLSLNITGVQLCSFGFGIAAVTLTYLISRAIGRGTAPILVLVLSGMVVATLFSSCTSITKYVADPDNKLPAITFWLMGGLSSIDAKSVWFMLPTMALGLVPLLLLRWKLNVLSFGEEEAKALGIDTGKLRMVLIFCSTLLTAAAVSVSGMIGWIGLVIPHLARMMVGPNYKVLLPASVLLGAAFLMGVDDVARSVFTMEIPLGILTSLLGAPFFVYLLLKGRKGWV